MPAAALQNWKTGRLLTNPGGNEMGEQIMQRILRRPILFVLFSVLSITSLLSAAEPASSQRVIALRDLPLLVADDSGVASSVGVVRTPHSARTLREPVLAADRPSEGSVHVYGSVYLDPDMNQLRLWYMGYRRAEGNADRGQLCVALLEADGRPIDGCGLEDCDPLKADLTRWTVRWKSGEAVPVDRPVRVVIEMSNTRLYSLACGNAP